ncbi:trimeric intracellular cation channel type 1B.1 [Hydra vulgaris]|nr:trimeric intracellular cation channel type 1B.1 [Hydra vulgaris]
MEYINNFISYMPSCPQELLDLVGSAKMWPLFVSVHYLLVAISMRSRTGSQEHAIKHPFASWFVCVTSCFAGQLLMNIMLGRPIIQIYQSTPDLLLASFIWYLIFFSPFDMAYELAKVKFIKATLLVLKEIHRVHSVKGGVNVAASIYSGNPFIIVLIGTIRGSGSSLLLHPFDALIRGDHVTTNEVLKPGFTTKHALLSAVLFVFHQNGFMEISENALIFLIFVVASITQVLLFLTKISDPYLKLEELFCSVLLSGPNEVHEVKKKKD